MLKLNTLSGFGSGAAAAGVTPHTRAVQMNHTGEFFLNSTDQSVGIGDVFTIIAWVSIDVINNEDTITLCMVEDNVDSSNQCLIDIVGAARPRMILWNDSAGIFKNYIATADPYTVVSTEYQLGMTWDGTNLKMWVNGSEETTLTKTTDNAGTVVATNRHIRAGNQLNGQYAKLSIWDAELDSASIVALYDSGNGNEHDDRVALGDYTETANLKHQYLFGNQVSPNIGEDFVDSGNINIEDNATGIADGDIVTF